MKCISTIVLAAVAATGVMSAAVDAPSRTPSRSLISIANLKNEDIPLNVSVKKSAAFGAFQSAPILVTKAQEKFKTRQDEPDPNRNATIPPYIFVLQCTDVGFRGDCLVFGAPPGDCVSYFDFNSENSTNISDEFNNQVVSLSTNTGGDCQFYKYVGCDNKGDDRGLTSNYNYDLGVPAPDDPRTVEYYKQITSWRC